MMIREYWSNLVLLVGISGLYVFKKVNSFWINTTLFIITMLVVSRFSYMAGIQSEKFDREHANLKLQQCLAQLIR